MNRLQLATLLSWAGDQGIPGRKRLQKVVFFLQAAGCDLDCEYTLHHFGPYSREVADACDEMVAAGLIEERIEEPYGNTQYRYALTPQTRDLLQTTTDSRLQPFHSLAKKLIAADIWRLELGSTILFYYRRHEDWQVALDKACEFKKVPATAAASQDALTLAQEVKGWSLSN